jgi:hypothetical protein
MHYIKNITKATLIQTIIQNKMQQFCWQGHLPPAAVAAGMAAAGLVTKKAGLYFHWKKQKKK